MARRPLRPESMVRPFAVLLLLLAGNVAAQAGGISGRVVLPSSTPPAQASAGISGLGSGLEGPPATAKAEPVIVYVAQAAEDLPRTPTPGARVRILRGKAIPALIPVSLGSEITFENGDSRGHHLVCRRGAQKMDLGALPRGQQHATTFDDPGTLRFECLQHGDVAFEVVVFAHAAFSLVDPKGNYTLPDLPRGHATVVAYSPRLGEISREIEITDSGSTALDFAF